MTESSVPAAPIVVVWIAEDTWRGCVDSARRLAPPDARLVLLYVVGEEAPGAAHGAYAGLFGRANPARDPGARVERFAAASASDLLAAAADRLGRPCTQTQRCGRVEREVVAEAQGAGLLIVARDGDRSRLGPKSLGPASRFIVDHAPCPVLLVWPEATPGPGTVPPPPPREPGRPRRPGPPHPRWHSPRDHGRQ